MTTALDRHIGAIIREINDVLERGFQECLSHTLRFQCGVEKSLQERTAFRSLSNDEIVKQLGGLCATLYEIIGETLFHLIPIFHGIEDEGEKQINFYFWPGYHSYLASRRIFIHKKMEEKPWNFGVGICGDPKAERLEHYHYDDCSQARWFHYLINPKNPRQIIPGDIHQWLLRQQPRVLIEQPVSSRHHTELYTPVSSLIVTTAPADSYEPNKFPDHKVLNLSECSQHTEGWGELLSNAVNEMGEVEEKDWKFPNRSSSLGRQQLRWRDLQSKMQAIWLHAAFCNYEPQWLDSFIQKLLAKEETQPAGEVLSSALGDSMAADWGDAKKGRPLFRNWINLSLHSWPAPGPSMLDLLSRRVPGPPEWIRKSQTVGSAAVLCSVPLHPIYLAVVRRWITAVYGMIRSAEISILFYNNHVSVNRAAMLAGPYFAHELKKLVDEGLSTVLQEAGDTSVKSVNNRRFVLYSLRALGNLAHSLTNAVLSGNKAAIDEEKEEFLNPLRVLRRKGQLQTALRRVAEEVYKNVQRKGGGRVTFSERDSLGSNLELSDLDGDQYCSCFLLVREMIHNYCRSGAKDYEARWKVQLKEKSFIIELRGKSKAQRNPASMTFAWLDVFLNDLGIGRASVDWDREKCTYTIEVTLSPTDTHLAA